MRADRLIEIVMLLQTRGKTTAKTLATTVNVSERTILRDVEALSLAGIPIYAEGGHGGGIALDENYRTTLTGLKEAEIRTLFISGNEKLLGEIGLGGAAQSTYLKLSAALPDRYQQVAEQVRQRIYIDPVWWWNDSKPLAFWSELQTAVFDNRPIQIVYENYSGEITERVLEPYSLVAKASHWYLIAKRDNQFRIYRLSRIHKVALLETHFERDEGFDLAAYWHDHVHEFLQTLAEYTFTLRLHTSRLTFAKWLTPGRCHILEPVDEEGWLTARFQLESMELAKMLVFGLGKDAVVLEPSELQEAVLQVAQELINTQAIGGSSKGSVGGKSGVLPLV